MGRMRGHLNKKEIFGLCFGRRARTESESPAEVGRTAAGLEHLIAVRGQDTFH
jgi:hypothetical protein